MVFRLLHVSCEYALTRPFDGFPLCFVSVDISIVNRIQWNYRSNGVLPALIIY